MSIRQLVILFFVSYGILIPVAATKFASTYIEASAAMIGCCMVIAFMFWSRRVPLVNIVLASWIFQIYLTRPFVSVFEPYLNVQQSAYIEGNNYFFNSHDAAVVYWSLLALLAGWATGLLCTRPARRSRSPELARYFTKIDEVVMEGGLPFWLSWVLLFALNYQSPGEGLYGGKTGEGAGLFLWGMADLVTIQTMCMFVFIRHRYLMAGQGRHLLLLPVLVGVAYSTANGSRSAIFTALILTFTYWLYLNMSSKRISIGQCVKALIVIAPVAFITIAIALIAQLLRPLLRRGADIEVINAALTPESILSANDTLFFGVTELLHRLSALKAPFMILNDRYIHDPWQYFNPVESLMRIINDLVPGDVFEGVLSINQVFEYIYEGVVLNYSSEMWSIQGTLYLYFGYWLSPIVVFVIGMLISRVYPVIEKLARQSASFAAVLIVFLYDLFNNGTVERVFIVDVVRPITSVVVFLVLWRAFRIVFAFHGGRKDQVATARPE